MSFFVNDSKGFLCLDVRSALGRILLGLMAVLMLGSVWFAVAWQFGNMIADFTKPTEPNAASVSRMALGLSPSDPLTNWLAASVRQEAAFDDPSGFEDVVRMSPNDYRWWGQLGRAFEQADKSKQAEQAFLYARQIAPAYVLPQWQIGNFYLRQGRDKEALEALKTAARRDPIYREQVFSVVWDYYEKDPSKVEEIAAGKPEVLSGLAKFYAARNLPQKSLDVWNRLSQKDRDANRQTAELIAQALYDKRYLNSAAKFIDELEIEKDAATGKILNGGFEKDLLAPEKVFFSWKVSPAQGIRTRITNFKKHSGKRSLEVGFGGYKNPEINNIYQTIPLEPGKSYAIEFWVKGESLASAGPPFLEVISANDSKQLARSEAFGTGTFDWKRMRVSFRVPSDAEGVMIRTAREICGEGCLLTGTFWYDDFSVVGEDSQKTTE